MLSGISHLTGWFKLNTKGSSVGNQGLASSGRIICDNNGNCVRAFQGPLAEQLACLPKFGP